MELSAAGAAFIKGWEACRLSAYADIGGVWTIGFGHTGNVRPGDTITREQADALFLEDLAPVVKALNRWLTWPNVKQCEFDAFCSLAYNIGLGMPGRSGGFKDSTVLKRYNFQGAGSDTSEAFLWWDKVNGQTSQGLLNRRKAEQSMFLGNPAPYNPIS